MRTVDRCHVDERLSEVGKAIYVPESDPGKQWTHERRTELKKGRIDALLAALSEHFATKEVRECRTYIKTNRHRMRHDRFHPAGLCTSSAVVE